MMEDATAAAKNRSLEIPPKVADNAEQSKDSRRAAVLMFVFQSGALTSALFPIVLWCSRGDMLLVVWRLSLLLCSYFYSAVYALSAAPAATKAGLLFHISCVALVAFFVDAELSQIAGMMIIYLDSVVMAGVFGHALAEHRESDGAEQAASAAAAKTLLDVGNGKVVHAPQSARAYVLVVVVLAFFFGCIGGHAKWFAECSTHGGCTVAEFQPGIFLFLVISGSLVVAIYFLEEDILGIDCVAVLGCWFLAIVALGGTSFLLVGTVALWMILLAVTAFFGHCVRVQDSYAKIIWCHILAAQIELITATRFVEGKKYVVIKSINLHN